MALEVSTLTTSLYYSTEIIAPEINKIMKEPTLRELPNDIQIIALERARNERNESYTIGFKELGLDCKVNAAFEWSETPEGDNVWDDISQLDFESFYAFHCIIPQEEINNTFNIF